ncbi:MAG: glycosyltransferase family 39 protein [Vicinamibacterales bacterium]
MRRPSRTQLALGAIALAALGLRCWGIAFGFPLWSNYYVRPDESLVIETAWRLGEDPRFFVYPAFMSTIVGAVFAVFHGAVRAMDASVPASLLAHAGASADPYFLLARLVSAVAGTAVVFPVFALASRLSSPAAGLVAAALAATAPLAVRDAHFAVTDTLMMTMAAFAVSWAAALPPEDRRLRDLVAVGALAGCAVATKYTAVFFAPAVLLGVWLGSSRPWRDLAVAAAASAATFVAFNPYLVAHLAELAGIARMLGGAVYERQGADGAWSPLRGLSNLLGPLASGPGLACGPWLAAAGLLVAMATRRAGSAAAVVCAAAAIGMALPLWLGHVIVSRYVLPLVPFVAVFAGVALDAPRGRWRRLTVAAAVVLTGAALIESIRMDRLLARDDTRTIAGRWLVEQVPAACPVVYWGPPEAEPQFLETAASVERRIQFAMAAYGPVSGEIVSRLYRVALLAPRVDAGRLEVFRNRLPDGAPPCTAVVTAGYPGWAAPAVTPAQLAASAAGEPWRRASFSPFVPGVTSAPIEPFDAFFLPLSALSRLERPGPVIDVVVFRIGSSR